jgi:hypothetical protein
VPADDAPWAAFARPDAAVAVGTVQGGALHVDGKADAEGDDGDAMADPADA